MAQDRLLGLALEQEPKAGLDQALDVGYLGAIERRRQVDLVDEDLVLGGRAIVDDPDRTGPRATGWVLDAHRDDLGHGRVP